MMVKQTVGLQYLPNKQCFLFAQQNVIFNTIHYIKKLRKGW